MDLCVVTQPDKGHKKCILVPVGKFTHGMIKAFCLNVTMQITCPLHPFNRCSPDIICTFGLIISRSVPCGPTGLNFNISKETLSTSSKSCDHRFHQ